LSADGHARLGGFLPPVPLPRRMYAGGRVEVYHPLHVGDPVSRTSRIADVTSKQGRTGALVFVKVRHEFRNQAGLALAEDQELVYRPPAKPDDAARPAPPAPTGAIWTREIDPDSILLFRYSALTFNGHRIHYDRRFATEAEGYPGLVVHGPLVATLLADLLRRNLPHADVSTFTFRAVSPLFDAGPFLVCGRLDAGGRTATLWAQEPQGALAMEATATL
jgi:3-methylfumaryl-CoA hydratase